MSEYLTTVDELIRTMCEDPSTIETREVAPDMVWAFVPRQVAIDDFGRGPGASSGGQRRAVQRHP